MKENELYSGIVKGAKQEGVTLFRITDGSVGKKPFDLCGIGFQGRAVGVEVKVWRKNKPLIRATDAEFKAMFESQQIPWLKEYDRMGGVGLIMVYDESTGLMMSYLVNGERFEKTHKEFYKQDGLWLGAWGCLFWGT